MRRSLGTAESVYFASRISRTEMNLAIVGAKGALGAELLRILPADDVLALDLPECDVTKRETIGEVLGSQPIDVVANLASYSRLDDAEKNPAPAFAVNAAGARLADLGFEPLRHWREAVRAYLLDRGVTSA